MKGLIDIIRNRVTLAIPPDVPPGEVWRYGLGFPFQVTPRLAGLFCNIRKEGTKDIDFEIGSDIVLFDNLEAIRPDQAIPLSRYETGFHPATGRPTLTRKGPVLGGFVPAGAKLADGSPHPHAGTGFGLCGVVIDSLGQDGHYDYLKGEDQYFELFQLAHDGKNFRILGQERVERKMLLPNANLCGNFITNAIPDGADLLYVMTAKRGNIVTSGITRWSYGEDGWRPISYLPATGEEASWGEPSLIRNVDGSLLFSARSSGEAVFDTAVWRSTDSGETWEQVIYRKECRARSPVSLNQAADGTPYIAANLPPFCRERQVLCLWPLDESRTGFAGQIIARDAPADFGPAPSGSWWRVDHPTSAIVRLADDRWHSLLVYRVADNGEIEHDALPPPQTGCYVEEVFSPGKAVPTWQF